MSQVQLEDSCIEADIGDEAYQLVLEVVCRER